MESNTQERRAYTRLPLALDARITSGREYRSCQIRDFCPGGLFLALPGDASALPSLDGRPIAAHDHVVVVYTVHQAGQPIELKVKVRVARIFPGGIGVEFAAPRADGVKILLHLANKQHQARQDARQRGDARSATDTQPLGPSKATTTAFLSEKITKAFEIANDALFHTAGSASSNAEQSECFDAMKELDSIKDKVIESFSGSLRAGLSRLENGDLEFVYGTENNAQDELEFALVDEEVFDDWLTIKNIVAKAEARYVDALYGLNQRLSVVAGKTVDDDNNPLALNGLCFTFHDAIRERNATRAARRAIFDAFDEALIGDLQSLYNPLNNELAARGILPTIEKPKPYARRSQGRGPEASAELDRVDIDPGMEVAPEPYAGDWPGTDNGHTAQGGGADPYAPHHAQHMSGTAVSPDRPPVTAMQAASQQHPRVDAPSFVAPGLASDSLRADAHHGAPLPHATQHATPTSCVSVPSAGLPRRDPYRTARNLLSLARQSVPIGANAARAPTASPTARILPSEQLIDELTRIQQSQESRSWSAATHLDLKKRVYETLEAEPSQLDETSMDAIEVMSNLFDAIADDPQISGEVKEKIKHLAVPLLKLAIEDESFLTDSAHPARQVVNSLGELGLASSSAPEVIDPAIEHILSSYDRDPQVFAEALGQIEVAVNEQASVYQERVAQIVEAQEQQQAIIRAHRGSGPSIDAATARRPVSPEWTEWLERARRVQVGDALVRRTEAGGAETFKAVWVDEDRDTFVLVDATGEHTTTLTAQELALNIRRGIYAPKNDADLPLVERGIHKMLGEMHNKLAHLATHDSLTGLLNRREFETRLEQSLSKAWRDSSEHVVCLIDLDGFSEINLKCGQSAGDQLLKKVALLLELDSSRAQNAARLGGDQFALLIEECDEAEGARIAEEHRKAISTPRFVWEGNEYTLGASFGLAAITAAYSNTAELLQAVERACAQAKEAGGNAVHIAEREGSGKSNQTIEASLETECELDLDSLRLRCQRVQPIGDEQGLKPHYEILLGVSDENGNLIDPTDFILTAERNNKMVEVDRWVIHNALSWMGTHKKQLLKVAGYSINLSGNSLGDPALLEFVLEQFTQTKVPPAKVVFEITETAAIDSESVAIEFMETIKEYGCHFSLDDFGTGHATYSYLRTFPVDYVKIDGLFVKELIDNPNDLAMVKSINEIGHFMGKKTIAEYVENDEVLTLLKDIGVDYAQGYGVERPMLLTDHSGT